MPSSGAPGAGPVPPSRGRIDFEALNAELLQRADSLVADWLPRGISDGREWKCGSLAGEPGRSCSVNLNTGQWADFNPSGGGQGGDLISLYAAIHGLDQGEAARELVDNLNLHSVIKAGPSQARASAASPKAAKPSPEKASAESEKKAHKGDQGEFVPIVPVPAHAPAPPAEHRYRGVPERVWQYTRDGQVLGYVYRFMTSDGGKEVMPLVWGQSQANGTQKWIWKQWDAPRPLYLPGGRLRPGMIRVVVEGEKCADALHALIGEEFDVLSWPGGGKAVSRADWNWLAAEGGDATGVRVIIWPDADAKRRKLTSEEKAAGVDPDTVDYLPAAKQPGQVAATAIAVLLHAKSADIWMGRLPPLPAAPDQAPARVDGWDCADAIAEGWTAEQCKDYLRAARRWEPTAPPSALDGLGSAGASGQSADPDPEHPKAWRAALLKNDQGAVKPARENVVLALQCLPETHAKIAFNEFTNDVFKLADMPWGSPRGKWTEVDELLMGEWLCRSHYFPSIPRTTLEEGMRMVATRHQYHPVREYLHGLKWDGTARLNEWLIRAAVAEPDKLGAKTRKYLQRVSAWFLMGMVARAMWPGCKFDYMPILEGAQGMRKSTVLNVLAGDWFADTGFVLGDKDSLQMLQGRWLYEISELDAMARAEVTKIKAFVASRQDWYRASFDKRPREYPRQLVFAGTTNEHQYLVDSTGNRRFWPVEVTRIIDTEWVQEVRDQLFAEAWHRVQQKERFHPTPREEIELFMPQQKERMVESPIEMRILDHLVNHAEGHLLASVQTVTLLAAIGIDITKLGPGRFHERQAGAALRKFSWERKRSILPGRPWVYVKPPGWPECMSLDDLEDEPAPAQAPAKTGPPMMEEEAILGAREPGQDDEESSNEPF